MRIKSFYTDQFAGLSLREPITFSDGMNVVLGNNETGKSTMISALYYTLNKSVKLNKKLKPDKEFRETMFPVNGAKNVDAVVSIEKDGEEYEIKKVWDWENEATGFSLKSRHLGTLRMSQAEAELKSLLEYGAAVYSNLIFGRQRNESEILEWCYRFFSSETDQGVEEARKKVTEFFSAAGGISLDRLSELIHRNIENLTGNWDIRSDQPKKDPRGRTKSWEKGNGTIIKAYYEYMDAKEKYEGAVRIENELARKRDEIEEIQREKLAKKSEKEAMERSFRGISERDKVEKLYAMALEKMEEAKEALSLWPEKKKLLEKTRRLRTAQEEAEKRRAKEELCQIISEVKRLKKENEKISEEWNRVFGYQDDEKTARKFSGRLTEIRGMLTAVKLRADVALEQDHRAVVMSDGGIQKEVSGREVVTAGGFVRVDIPGVASIQVSPQELDIEGLLAEEKQKKSEVGRILKKYGVNTLEELEEKVREFQDKEREMKGNQREIERLSKRGSVQELERESERIVTDQSVVIPDSLEDDIRLVLSELKKASLESAEGMLEEAVKGYEKKYRTEADLSEVFERSKMEVDQKAEELKKYGNVPPIGIEAFHREIKELDARMEEIDKKIGDARTEAGRLSAEEETDMAGLEASVEEKRQRWLCEKKKYEYYDRIRADFNMLRSEEEDQLTGFYGKLDEYLRVISDGNISLHCGGEGLCLESHSKKISAKELLSEGTKKTLALAFRLAVLGYFFPDGGGLVVLDDDLLDMDPVRRGQAAKLLHNFSQSNQVIFVTCDPAIAELLGGNRILM